MSKDTGGPVYPIKIENHSAEDMVAFGTTIQSMKWNQWGGITLRQYFANNCPDAWIEITTPKTVGEMRDEMITRGILPPSAKHNEVHKSYNNQDKQKLYIALRYEYADAMIAEGNKQ